MQRRFLIARTTLGGALLLAAAPLAEAQEPGAVTSSDTVHVAPPTGEREADRANVQAAFDAVQPGGTVLFAAGSYLVGGEGLVLRTPGVALRGDPDGTTLLGCTQKQRMDLSADDFSEVCGDGFVLAAEAQRVSGLRLESFLVTRVVTEPARRHHLHESAVQRAVTAAVRRAGLGKRASCHSFRHSFATLNRGALAAQTMETDSVELRVRRNVTLRVRCYRWFSQGLREALDRIRTAKT